MKTSITFEIDTDQIGTYNDSYIVSLWHVAQANPADPFKDHDAGQLAEIIGREIVRRFVTRTPPELWHHQGAHFDWGARHLSDTDKPE